MYLVINKWVIAVKVSNFSGQYLRNHWTLDIGVLGYIGIVWPKEHSPEVSHIPPLTPCMWEAPISFIPSLCLSVYMYTCVSAAPAGQISLKFDIRDFILPIRKSKFG